MIFLNRKKKTEKDTQMPIYEKCVICGKLTDVPRDTPIELRKTYMVGAGQLCRECCREIYKTDDLRDIT